MRTLHEQRAVAAALGAGKTVLRVRSAGSVWSDALSSHRRCGVLHPAMAPLLTEARAVLPDRLLQLPARQGRPAYAMDGSYQSGSAHYGQCTPRQGGQDNSTGHALLRDYDQSAQAMTRHKGALWLVDRAFIGAAFWDGRQKRLGVTTITRIKNSLRIDSTDGLAVVDVPLNERVFKHLCITLRSSRQRWRLIIFCTRRDHLLEFLTNEFKLEPGVIAFLHSRRGEEEKCFDTWKNGFSQTKA